MLLSIFMLLTVFIQVQEIEVVGLGHFELPIASMLVLKRVEYEIIETFNKIHISFIVQNLFIIFFLNDAIYSTRRDD